MYLFTAVIAIIVFKLANFELVKGYLKSLTEPYNAVIPTYQNEQPTPSPQFPAKKALYTLECVAKNRPWDEFQKAINVVCTQFDFRVFAHLDGSAL